MPSTYIVITRKTLQSLPNSFANPLANWFFHLSSYVRVSYKHIYIYICYIFQCLYFGWKNEKKKKKERWHRQATSSVTRKNHLSVRESFGSRTRCTRHFDPFANDARSFGAFLPSPPLASQVESSRGEARVGFEVALTAKKIFVNGIEGRSCFCFRPRSFSNETFRD